LKIKNCSVWAFPRNIGKNHIKPRRALLLKPYATISCKILPHPFLLGAFGMGQFPASPLCLTAAWKTKKLNMKNENKTTRNIC
jgi:hypothetical protein